MKKNIRIGPRFFLGLYRKNSKRVLLKTSLGQRRDCSDIRRICKRLSRESKFLEFFSTYRNSFLKKAVPRLVDYETKGYAWYLKEYIDAKPQNINNSNFLFQKRFFTEKSSFFLAKFFSELHKASKDFPSSFKRMIRRYPFRSHERYANYFIILDRYDLGYIRNKIKEFLDSKIKLFDNNQNVITHFEAFAPHILRDKNDQYYLIDWENLGWGSPARDIATLWMRAFEQPEWRKDLIKKFLDFSLPSRKKHFKDLFEIEVILQGISNLGYFRHTRDKDEIKAKNKIIGFFEESVKKALRKELLEN